jgi:alkylation response protein AidB-like acyl-CoA dehydrogenase
MIAMYFGLSTEQQAFQHALRDFFRAHSTSHDVRRLMDEEPGYDGAVWSRMAGDLGLPGLAIPQRHGGSGASFFELAIAIEEAGYALAGGPLFASAVLAATCLQASGDTAAMAEYLPGIADGSVIATVAVADEGGTWDPSGFNGVTAHPDESGYRLTGTKSYVLDGHAATLVLVLARAAEGLTLFAVPSAAEGLTWSGLPVLDRTRRMSSLELASVPGRMVGAAGGAEPVIVKTLQAAAVALAAEQVGGIRRCLDIAVEYAKLRVQFSRPIGSFQAIKHMCADMYTLLETARSAALYAAWCVANDTTEVPMVASLAKAYCSEAYYQVAADSIQLHGGIGFTWEHECHLFFKRATASLQFLGSPQYHRELLAQGIKL